jgi:hypothetical protein
LVYSQLRGEAERRLPINDAEVDRFCGAPMFGGLRDRPDAENFLGGARMDILPGAERFDEHGVFRKVRQDAQLDL